MKDSSSIDYSKVGLVCGLEIHQQLNTSKLFCKCPSNLIENEKLDKQVTRRLRFSLAESGDEIDKAALAEFKKDKYFIYKYNDDCACLVDLDEEPPVGPNKDALDVAFKISRMLDLKFFDKLQFMRKLIVNGSITSGYQRTVMLGVNGVLKTPVGDIKINGINLEEDACKIIEKKDEYTVFGLDRQGIPLIEITTGPNLHTPQDAQAAAYQLGNLLRSFPQTKRGLGTIRQDLNVSIEGGSRIEIKGAQNVRLIPQIIDNEILRQKSHLEIIEKVKSLNLSSENISDNKIYDITKLFDNTLSEVIKKNLSASKNSKVLAIKLNNFKGILGMSMQENHRLATEISDKNKHHFPKIKGLFHLDEMPNYGISQEELSKIKNELSMLDNDSFIMIAAQSNLAKDSLEFILETIKVMITNIPEEVRQVDPKGVITKFLRPMPGSSRMYPETDIKDIVVDKNYIDSLEIPEIYDIKLSRLKSLWSIEENKVEDLLNKFSEDKVKEMINVSQKNANSIYSIIFDIPKDIKKRDSIEPIDLDYDLLLNLLKQANKNDLNQKSIRDIFISLYKNNLSRLENLDDYLKSNNLITKKVDTKDVEEKIKQIIKENSNAPFGALMGIAMKQFNGAVDGKIISQVLKKLLN